MATKLSRALHLPRFSRPGALGLRSPRAGRALGRSFPGAAGHPLSDRGRPAPAVRGWGRRALREGVLVTLLTSLMTSAVLAAPQVFRQSPDVSWRQFTAPVALPDQTPAGGVLLDCP